jgi:hypothetical protein
MLKSMNGKKSKKSKQVKNLKWIKMREVRKCSSSDVDSIVNKPLLDNDLESRSRMMEMDSKLNNPTIYGILKNVEAHLEELPDLENPKKTLPKKLCGRCNKEFSKANIAKHSRKCTGSESRRQQVMEMRKLIQENSLLREEIKEVRKENEVLKLKLKNEEPEIFQLKDVTETKKLSTKKSYNRYWKRYEDFCVDNGGLPIRSVKSVIEFFNSITNSEFSGGKPYTITTKKTIRSVLATTFKTMFGKDISHLLKVKNAKKRLPKAKYSLNNEEVYGFLKSLKNSVQDFIPMYVLIFSGCRVHSLAMLKKSAISGDTLNLYDHKTEKDIPFKIESETILNMLSLFAAEKDLMIMYSINVNLIETLKERKRLKEEVSIFHKRLCLFS